MSILSRKSVRSNRLFRGRGGKHRYFDVETQLSEQLIDKVVIVPDLSESTDKNDNVGLTEFLGKEATWWMKNSLLIHDRINSLKELDAGEFLITSDSLFRTIEGNSVVEWGPELFFRGEVIRLEAEVQPAVNKPVRFAGRAFARQADGSLHGLSLFYERYATPAIAGYFLGQGA